MKILIKHGKIISDKESIFADLLISGEKISAVASNLLPDKETEVIDANGLYVMPGGVDPHVHLDLPMAGTVSSDDHYTGTRAAAFGGTTTVIDFVSQDSDDLLDCVASLRKKADEKVTIDYSLHMNITHLTPEVELQIPALVNEGITSVKVFTAYNNRLRLHDDEIFKVMRIGREFGILTMLHAENGDLIDLLVEEALEAKHKEPIWHAKTRPAWGAVESALRGSAIAAVAGAPMYLVHMNTGGEVDQLEYAQEKGLTIIGETCPQYLFFTESDLERPDGSKWVCSPPVRRKDDQRRLWEGLRKGIIHTVGTDHCPFFYDGAKTILFEGKEIAIPGKELGKEDFTKIPNGLPGVGDRLPVMWTKMVNSGEFTENKFVELNSTNPAKIFGMYPQKGALQPGSDADVVLWDPEKEIKYGLKYAMHRTDYNLYEGWVLKGFPITVFSRGKKIVENGEWLGQRGWGKFIQQRPFKIPD